MIFVFTDDYGLMVLETIEDVQRQCEGIDVENGVYHFFDDNCNILRAQFDQPNRKQKIVGPLSVVSSGKFSLANTHENSTTLLSQLLQRVVHIEKNHHFKTIEEARIYLTRRCS